MTDLIRLLPDHIANQIAAGEVIQRPASVIKELVENAIDAGADKIEVHIKDAGKTLIQIIDNGSGMSKSDAQLCFARHATSKVSKADDLFQLRTKGFRGEALASIAAIAHVNLKTCQLGAELGTFVQIEGSEIKKCEETVCPQGTTFEVKNLFYNVPARRNFLKSNEVEFKHIRYEFERIALAHEDIEFTLTHNGHLQHHLPVSVLKQRIQNLIGKKMTDRLVPIEESTDIVQIHGFVTKPEYAKKQRDEQFLFVNHRFFKDAYFNHAINKAYDGMLQPKTFPGYFLYFTVDPSKIDVNVHPTKTEIKFEEDKFIYAILVSSIRQALGKYNIVPTLDFERETSFDLSLDEMKKPIVQPQIQVNPEYNPFETKSSSAPTKSVKSGFTDAMKNQGFGQQIPSQSDWDNFYQIEEENQVEQSELALDEVQETAHQFIFQAPFLLIPTKGGFLTIHVNRGRERIIYEELHQLFIQQPISSQQLLFPIEKEISSKEKNWWNDHQVLLQRLGFEGQVQEEQLQISAVPALLPAEDILTVIEDIMHISDYQDIDKGDIAPLLLIQIAKSGSRNKFHAVQESVNHFVESLFQCPEHVYSPSGKKIMEKLTLEELTNKF